MMSSVCETEDELVSKVVCCRQKPKLLYLYCAPFAVLYSIVVQQLYSRVSIVEQPEIWLMSIGILGIVHLITFLSCYWSEDMRHLIEFTREPNINKATHAFVKPTPNNGSPEVVLLNKGQDLDNQLLIWFIFQKAKYIYVPKEQNFVSLYFPVDKKLNLYLTENGLQDEMSEKFYTALYGPNVMVMDLPQFRALFIERATAPFFVFQVFCVGLWCMDDYWIYSLFTLGMLVVFECMLVYQQLKNLSEIRKMGNEPFKLKIFRNSKWRLISSADLLPGDYVQILSGRVPCDMLLLSGSCIVDESLLTGESVPQMKESIESLSSNELDRKLDLKTDSKLHVLSGGTEVMQFKPPESKAGFNPPDNGCVCYVLRTGFSTTQGKLLRTILYSVKRVTANNLETFFFILFLLIFAIIASGYLWIEGSKNPSKSKYKLFLECILILTSVVPPELPIELTLAVNTSLLALAKLYVFCTEPFRLPFAGKVSMCCFDKTGTLTSDNLVVEGITCIKDQKNPTETVLPVSEVPIETIQVLAGCNSLIVHNNKPTGDPLEKSIFTAIDWSLTKSGAVVPNKGKSPGLRIVHRFHFTSTLKRMSTIVSYSKAGSTTVSHLGLVKGAPEMLRSMFVKVPPNYDEVYTAMSKKGSRVLALGRRDLGNLSQQQIKDMTRPNLEKNFEFAGFVVVSCPLKPDSKLIIHELMNSSHYLRMITGDAPLTACHVGRELGFCRKEETLIFTEKVSENYDDENDMDTRWIWKAIKSDEEFEHSFSDPSKLYDKYDLCITGDGVQFLLSIDENFFRKLLPQITIYARVSPKQKEMIINTLKSLGFCTLMCGDGTNDVGALKQAEVGVALITNAPLTEVELEARRKKLTGSLRDTEIPRDDHRDNLPRNKNSRRPTDKSNHGSSGDSSRRNLSAQERLDLQRNIANQEKQDLLRTLLGADKVDRLKAESSRDRQNRLRNLGAQERQERFKKLIDSLGKDEQLFPELGDASIAAPFTYKLSSINCVTKIIKQGRCTLVTTLQMFKILALNALVLAYSHSVLYLDGVKFSDGQATMQGLLLAGCFLFISRSKPLDKLSKARPLPNIFNFYTISTVIVQFFVHFTALIYLVREAKSYLPQKDGFPDLDEEFSPNLLNSVVWIISLTLQVATFTVNYKGPPFMESMSQNKPLLYSIVGPIVFIFVIVTGLVPGLAESISIVELPESLRHKIMLTVIADLVLSYVVDSFLQLFYGYGKLKPVR